MRTLWALIILGTLLAIASLVEAHSSGTYCQTTSGADAAPCHQPNDFKPNVSLSARDYCGSTNLLTIPVAFPSAGYAHYTGGGYATSGVLEYSYQGGPWQWVSNVWDTYSRTYTKDGVAPGSHQVRVTVNTQEGSVSQTSAVITTRACTSADFAPRSVLTSTSYWTTCGYRTTLDSTWDSNSEGKQLGVNSFSHFEIVPYQGGVVGPAQTRTIHTYGSGFIDSPSTGSRSYQIQVTAVMTTGERSATATGPVITQRLCTPSDITFNPTASVFAYHPCGEWGYNYVSWSAPTWVSNTYKTAWQKWTLERQVQGTGSWTNLYTGTSRNGGSYVDYTTNANGPKYGVTYEYRASYVGLEGVFPGNTVSSRLEDCPTAKMTSVHMTASCPPRIEVKWRLEPRPQDTQQPPSAMSIQRSTNGFSWTTLNEYANGGIAHQKTKDAGFDHEWWNYDVYGGTTYWYRITYTFGSKGSTTSAAMASDAPVQKCNAPELMNLQGQNADHRGMGGYEGSIDFDLRWTYLDAATPAETVQTWLNGANYYRVNRCDSHPPVAMNTETYRVNGHTQLTCTGRTVLRSDLQASPSINLNHVKDANVWGNISYTYQGVVDTRTDDYYSNKGSTWVRGEPWPIESMRIESFPYLHQDPDSKSPPGDYPPELATTPDDARFGHAEITLKAGNDGGGGPNQEYEITFRYEGKTSKSVVCHFSPATYADLAKANGEISWKARANLTGLVYPKDFTGPDCQGPTQSLKEGTTGHVVLVRARNSLGWSNALQVDGIKAWRLDLGEESTSHSDPSGKGSASPTAARTKTLVRTDEVTHDVTEAASRPTPLNPAGYTGPRYPGTTAPEAFLRNAEPTATQTLQGQPCQGPVVHQLYLNEQRGEELYGAKGERLRGFDASYAKVKLWFFASQVDFDTTDNDMAQDARAPLRYYEFTRNDTWLGHSDGRLAFVNQDTDRDEDSGYTPPDEDVQWISKDSESYADWEAFFQDDDGIPGDQAHFDFPDADDFRLPFNGMGKFCLVDNLTADGEIAEKSRTCSFQYWRCDTKATDWKPGNPHYLAARIDVGDTATVFTHAVYGKVFEEQGEFVSDEGDQRPRVPHNPPASDSCKCFRQVLKRTPEEHRLTQRFTSDYNLYEELQSRGNGRPAAGTESMFFDDAERPEDPPVDAQFMQQYDGALPQAIKDEIARRNLEGAAGIRPPNGTAGEPETPAETQYYSNGTQQDSGQAIHPYLGHVWAELVPDRSVWWNGSFLVDGSFRPVLWVGATASPMVDWMEAHNITMAPPHIRWKYHLDGAPEDEGFVGPPAPKLLREGDGWELASPELNLTKAFLANSTGRLTLLVDFGWQTRDEHNETIHELNFTTSLEVYVHLPTLPNATLHDTGVPVLKYDENPRGQEVVRAFWHSYPETRAPWTSYDAQARTYGGTPEALFFRTGFADHYEYRDPDPTPTGAWHTGEQAVNATAPAKPAHPDDQTRLQATDEFLHLAMMPRNRNQDDGVLSLGWTLFDTRKIGTATSPGPEDARFNVVRTADGDKIVSYGWLNNATYDGAPSGTVLPVEGEMSLEYLIRVTPTLNWDGDAQRTRLDSSECRHGRWSLQVTYADGSTATAGSVSQERCMTNNWRAESIPLQAGKGIQSISLVGKPYVSMSFQCDEFSCGQEPDNVGRNSVHNVYLDGMRIRKQVPDGVSYLHLWDYYQPSLPLFEETGFHVNQFHVETAKIPLSPTDAAERYAMVTPGDPFLVFLKVPDLPEAGTNPFLHPHLVQGIMLGQRASSQPERGDIEDELSRIVQQRELELAESLDWTDPASFPYEWYKDASDSGLDRHVRGPWFPSASNAYLRYWTHLRGDADKDGSETLVPDEDANPSSPGQRTLNQRFLPSFSTSFATHLVHTTDEHPDGPDFYRSGWWPAANDGLRDYYLDFQNDRDAAYLRNFEGTDTYLTTVAVDDLPGVGLAASPIWPFHDLEPTNITLGDGFNLTVGAFIPGNETWSPHRIEEQAAQAVLENVTREGNTTHVEVHPLPVHLDGCWRFLTADNGTAIDPGLPGSNASLAGWQNVDHLNNVTSNITKRIQVRIYATVHRGTADDEARLASDVCRASNNHTVPIDTTLRVAILYREAEAEPGAPPVLEGIDRMAIGYVDVTAPHNATSSYIELEFNATGVPTFYAIYDSWETFLKGDTMLIGQFDGPAHSAGRLNWASMLAIAILAIVAPYMIHRGYSAFRLWLGGS